jgi:hypothetical protein
MALTYHLEATRPELHTSPVGKRKFSAHGLGKDDDDEGGNKRSRKRSIDQVPDIDYTHEKLIPCFVDECPGKDRFASSLM